MMVATMADSPATTPSMASSFKDGEAPSTKDEELGGLEAPITRSKLSAGFLSAGMPVSFQSLTYTAVNSRSKREKIDLLKGVSGFLRPGEMSALMGPSGSGKTALLDVVAGRKTGGQIGGEIKIAGTKPSQAFMRRYTGYTEQFDTLLPILTVEEILLYTAELKRPITQSRAEKQEVVDELIECLGLAACRGVPIGSSMHSGISGGQRKRVNIGIALVPSPKILFLDEPFSGLDSFTANEVMAVVKSLSELGLTVIASIHSPTPYIFNLFDRLLMLLRGSVIYFGPNGQAPLDYFYNTISNVPALKAAENEAEWLVGLTTQADWQGRADELAKLFAGSEARRIAEAETEQQLQRCMSLQLSEADLRDLAVKREIVTPAWWALKILLQFRTLKYYRSFEFLAPRVADKLVLSIVMFSLYWMKGDEFDAINTPNIVCMLFMWTVLAAFGAMISLPTLFLERPLFMRERSDGLYCVGTYLANKLIEELGVILVTSFAFANLVFWTINLQGSFLVFWLIYLVSLAIGVVLTYFIAAISPVLDVANAIFPTYITMLLFFMGLLLRWENIPSYWRWFAYIDFLRYSWGSLMVNQFDGAQGVTIQGQPSLEYYSLEINEWSWLGIEFAFFVFFTIAAYLALSYIRWGRR